MDNSYETSNGCRTVNNSHMVMPHIPYLTSSRVSLPYLDLRVFYVRISKCEIDSSTPESLTIDHIPLNPDTLLEVNGVRTSLKSDGASTLLRRDRLDKKAEETTFVSTDSIRMTGSVKFEVFDKDVRLLSGVLELCNSDGFVGESRNNCQGWSMNIDSDITIDTCFLKANQFMGQDSFSPTIEVYVAGSFLDSPIILTKTMQLVGKRQITKGPLGSIPECEASACKENFPIQFALQESDYPNYKPENEDYNSGMEYFDGEDEELSWFNAGVRVGVGIGLSMCVGIGIGVGLLVRTYQGTARNFRRRLM